MKYFVLLCDGAADRKNEPAEKTPLEAASKPTVNMLSYRSFNGFVSGSFEKYRADIDAAHIAVLGFDPGQTEGFFPFEAANAGASASGEDTVYKCSFLSLSNKKEAYENKKLLSVVTDLTKEETAKLISALNKGLSTKIKKFYALSASEGCLVWKRAPENVALTAPSDVSGAIGRYLPTGSSGAKIVPLLEKSCEILADHPVNVKRREEGKKPVSTIWLHSPEKLPAIEPFEEKWKVTSAVITNSPVLKGAAACLKMKTADAPVKDGAEDFEAEAKAVIDEFNAGTEFVMLQTSAVSEAALNGDRESKIKAIENVDSLVLAPVYEYLCGSGDQFKILFDTVLPAPVADKSFSEDPAPFFMYSSQRTEAGYKPFSEINAGKGGFHLPEGEGYKFMSFLVRIPAPEKEETQEENGQQQ